MNGSYSLLSMAAGLSAVGVGDTPLPGDARGTGQRTVRIEAEAYLGDNLIDIGTARRLPVWPKLPGDSLKQRSLRAGTDLRCRGSRFVCAAAVPGAFKEIVAEA
ncbi:MAG: hypothetical protein JKY75_03770 [Erythrobacter sp.]|nr:hypothetical protein [Erythrobacter sp.]